MAKIISIINQKGGVGKSTTAHAMAAGLKGKGQRVLLVELDHQGNLTFTTAADTAKPSAYDLLTRQTTAAECIQKTAAADIIIAGEDLAGADMDLTAVGKEYRLKEGLEPTRASYDYIIIDTPPALGVVTINALTASEGAIIPAQADSYSLQGISKLQATLEAVKRYTNPQLKLEGILLTRHNARAILSQDLADMMKAKAGQMGTFVYNVTIRECIAIKEAQTSQLDIFSYSPKSNAAEDYAEFIAEYLERGRKD